jgi:hypothetical protein
MKQEQDLPYQNLHLTHIVIMASQPPENNQLVTLEPLTSTSHVSIDHPQTIPAPW